MFQFRLFPREPYDYKRIFSQHIAQLRSLQSRDKLLDAALASLAEVFAVSSACILLREHGPAGRHRPLVLKARLGTAPLHYALPAESPLSRWLQSHDEPLTIEKVEAGSFPAHAQQILKVFIDLKAAALVPIRAERDLLGLIAIGAPRRRQHYRREEKELLALFGFELSISIQNAYLYEEIIRQNAKLKELSQLKNSFIGNITHELATPLHNIIGLAQALAEGSDGRVSREQRDHLKMICQAGEQLLQIHRAILDLAQLESSPESLTIKKINIRRMIDELMPWLKEEAATRHNAVVDEIGPSIPGIYGDEERIRQVFEKLLENATRFTSQGEIRIGAVPSGDMLRIAIQDTGTGIDPAYHESIFEAFRQVDSGYSRQHGGPGLGLTVAKKIIELHGGRLWLESRPGVGSCFYFTLPLRPANIRSLELG